MLTLFYSPQSRATRIIGLLYALNIMDQVDVRVVDIVRQDGSGGHDPKNPHPEGKVPLLVHDGVEIWESAAIILYLTDLFPESGLGVPVGHPERGRYVSWLAWYGSVMEPVMAHTFVEIEHPMFQATFRGMPELVARLETALTGQDWLVAGRYTAADLLIASPYQWFADATPDVAVIKDWVKRCSDQPFGAQVEAFESRAMAA